MQILPLGTWVANRSASSASRAGVARTSLVKPEEEPPRLVGRCVAQLDLAVDASRANRRRVQPLRVIGREEEDPSLSRTDAVKRVQEPAQGDALSARSSPARS